MSGDSEKPTRWDDLRYLAAVVEFGGAIPAARQLGVATSTVYRRLEALAIAMGTPVLVRGVPEVRLTKEGEHLYQLACRFQSDLGAARHLALARRTSVEGVVRLTTVEGFLPLLLAPLAELAESHSELCVELHLADAGPSVRKRDADIAIGVMENPPPELIGRRLFQIEHGVFGTAEAIAREPRRWIVCGPPQHSTKEAAWEKRHAENAAIATGSRNAFVALVRQGVGVGLLPRRLAQPFPELKELPKFREAAREVARQSWVLYHPDASDVPSIRAVVDTLVNHLSRLRNP